MDYANFSVLEMVSMAKLINANFSKKSLKFILGRLNITSFSSGFESFVKHLDVIKINDLDCLKAERDIGANRHYHSMGYYAKGINTKQLDYILCQEQQASLITEVGINRQYHDRISKNRTKNHALKNSSNQKTTGRLVNSFKLEGNLY